jgi:site-specific DNA-cytosine methylase
MELCSGAGGTSFVCQKVNMHGKEMELRAQWAFDINDDACAAYQLNDPGCHVYVRGIDEALMLSKLYEIDVLSKWSPEAMKGKDMGAPSKVRLLLVWTSAHV